MVNTGRLRRVWVVVLAPVLLMTAASAVAADGPVRDFRVQAGATLSGDQEVPPVATEMSGVAEVVVRQSGIGYRLRIRNNTSEIFAIHIHCGAPGSNGPVGAGLFSGSFTRARGTISGRLDGPADGNGCGWGSNADAAAALLAGNAYINVHTTADSGGVPSGEVRGDLGVERFRVRSWAELSGDQEVPAVETDMGGTVDVAVRDDRLRFKLKVQGNSGDIFGAHIHCAAPGANGPLGVGMFAGSFTKRAGVVTDSSVAGPNAGNGCGWTSLADAAIAVLTGQAYVNVHTTADSGGVPSGEIRGDL